MARLMRLVSGDRTYRYFTALYIEYCVLKKKNIKHSMVRTAADRIALIRKAWATEEEYA